MTATEGFVTLTVTLPIDTAPDVLLGVASALHAIPPVPEPDTVTITAPPNMPKVDGSVVLDRDRRAWILWDDTWHGTDEAVTAAQLVTAYGPLTVLHDASVTP